jgi:hypothetical protein
MERSFPGETSGSEEPVAGGFQPTDGQGAHEAPETSQDEGGQAAAENAKQAAQGAAERVQGMAREQVDQRSTEAGERVSSVASDLRGVGDQLRSQQNEGGAKIAEQAAERAERAGSYLTEANADRILADAEDFGRRQPWLVLAGGVALGVAAARFLKASSADRYSRRTSETSGSTGQPRQLTGSSPAAAGGVPVAQPTASPAPAEAPIVG